eukprot:Colp12_sorted_trinity150504_noHs@19532
MQGVSIPEIIAKGWQCIYDGAPENGFESFEQLNVRVRDFIKKLREQFSEHLDTKEPYDIACVTHGDCVLSAILLADDKDGVLANRMSFDQKRYPATASVTTLVFDSKDQVIPGLKYFNPDAEHTPKGPI